MTKVKPQRIDANNSPQVGYVPKYVDEQTFEWGAGSGATDIGNNYLILTGTMVGTPPEVDITDTRITDTTPYLVFFETQPVGNITRTLTNGNLNIASDDNSDTLDVKILFWNIGPARQYMKGNISLTGAGPRVITDPRIIATTPAMIMPRIVLPVGYITAVTGAGTMTISSTGTEVGAVVDYIITLDTTNYSDGMPYNPTLDDDDMFFRKGISGDDEAVKWGDLKSELNNIGMDSIIAGTDHTAASLGTFRDTTAVLYTKIKQAEITKGGTYTITFLYGASNGGYSRAKLYINGVAYSSELQQWRADGMATYTVDLLLSVGDTVEVWAMQNTNLMETRISDFSIKYNLQNEHITTINDLD